MEQMEKPLFVEPETTNNDEQTSEFEKTDAVDIMDDDFDAEDLKREHEKKEKKRLNEEAEIKANSEKREKQKRIDSAINHALQEIRDMTEGNKKLADRFEKAILYCHNFDFRDEYAQELISELNNAVVNKEVEVNKATEIYAKIASEFAKVDEARGCRSYHIPNIPNFDKVRKDENIKD